MRAALDRDVARRVRCQQRRQYRLQHQRAAARRADRETVVASAHLSGREGHSGGTEGGPFDSSAAHFDRGQDRRQMLAQQPRPLAARANVLNAERLPGGQGKAQRITQDLPAAFAERSIDPNHNPVSQHHFPRKQDHEPPCSILLHRLLAGACVRSPADRPAQPSPRQSACRPPASRRSRPRPSRIRCLPSSAGDPPL